MRLLKVVVLLGVIISITACSQVKHVSIIDESTIRDDILSFLEADLDRAQAIENLEIISQIQDGKIIRVVASFDFSTDSANLGAKMNLRYSKKNDIWSSDNETMTIESTDIIRSASSDNARIVVESDPVPLYETPSLYLFNDSKLSFVNEDKASNTGTAFNFKYTDRQLNWSLDQTFSVKATFNYKSGWTYRLSDWSYEETSDWSGNWKIVWYALDGSRIETFKDIVVTGTLKITNDMTGRAKTVSDPLQVNFTLDGKSYQVSGVVDDKQGTTRVVEISYGSNSNDWFNMVLNIAGPIPDTGDASYAAFWPANNEWLEGVLTKID